MAIEEGFYMKSSQETGSAKDILLLFRHHCETSPRHLTFEILRPGSTLILAKICSSSSPPWFSSLLATISEATRKYSQVSAKTLTFSVISDEHAGHALTNLHSTTLSSLQELAFPTFLCQSSLHSCIDDTSAKTILIIR